MSARKHRRRESSEGKRAAPSTRLRCVECGHTFSAAAAAMLESELDQVCCALCGGALEVLRVRPASAEGDPAAFVPPATTAPRPPA